MGKARDLFKNIRDSKGTFHAKMGLIKDRNGMNLTEAEDIKKRWQEYTEKLRYKKVLMIWITMEMWSLTWSQTPWRVKSGLLWKQCVLLLQSCPPLCDPMDHQAPLYMGFSRQEYWSGFLGPPPGDLPNPGIEPMSPALQAYSLWLNHLGSLEGSLTMNKTRGGD